MMPYKNKKYVWTLVITLSLILFGEILWLIRYPSGMAVNQIIFESDLAISDKQLLEMTGITDERLNNIQIDFIEEKLAAWPVVQNVRVTKIFPDSLKIELYKRKPVAAAFSVSDNSMIMALFDRHGYIVTRGNLAGEENLPILSGPSFGKPVLGARLPTVLHRILWELGEVKKLDPELYSQISEVEILPHNTENFYLRLYTNNRTVPVIIGDKLTADVINRAILVGNIFYTGTVGRVVEADIRGNSVVYRRMGDENDV